MKIRCYVDDPWLAVRGTQDSRTLEFVRLVAVETLDCCLAWNTRDHEQKMGWIGCQSNCESDELQKTT